MSLFNDIQNGLSSGFGKSLVGAVSSRVPQVGNILNQANGVLTDLNNGDLFALSQRLLSGLGGKGGANGIGTDSYYTTPQAGFAGLSPQEAFEIYKKHRGIHWCFKNLWYIEVSSELKGDNELLNMVCHGLDFAPFTVSGEKKQIGSAHVDLVNSSDPVELSMTVYDNSEGEVKQWFEDHAAVCAPSDGTVGVPSKYAIKIKIVHAFVNKKTNKGGYISRGLFRPANLQVSLSRAEQSLSELTMTFVQLDTFMGNK